MYEVRKVEAWQIWYTSPSEERPVDGEKLYPSRQNAYARCAQMNREAAGKKIAVDVILSVPHRKDCRTVLRIVEEKLGPIARVEDPLFFGSDDPDDIYAPTADERRVTFTTHCYDGADDIRSVQYQRYQPMTTEELKEWLLSLRGEMVSHVYANIHGAAWEA